MCRKTQGLQQNTVKKDSDFLSRDVSIQILPGGNNFIIPGQGEFG
jgi:hypothetical protein